MSPTSTLSAPKHSRDRRIPPLQPGDRLTRAEFERRFDATPNLKVAELIEGVVFMPPPVSQDEHSSPHFDLITVLGTYRAATPGIEGGDNGSLRLDLDNMPQPDAFLRILESHGGQSRIDSDGYVEGAPELIAEVAATSASYDLHAKLNVYRRNGVKEYIVWRVLDRAIDYFILRDSTYQPLPPAPSGIFQSQVFPGLWLEPEALINEGLAKVFAVLQKGIASRKHAAFVTRLKQAGKPPRRRKNANGR
jgi:Uma2 family endonuclease